MNRDIRRGHLEIDFPARPFRSASALLRDSARLYLRNLGPLTAITLVTVLPGKLLLQLLCSVFDVAPDGLAAYLLMDASDLLLGAWAVPAAVYLLVAALKTGGPASIREALRWGKFVWQRMFWNKFKVEITVALWSLLLLVPGILAMVRLSLTDVVVAIEGVTAPDPLHRSEQLTEGRRARIFTAFLPLGILSLAADFLSLKLMALSGYSRLAIALSDSLLSLAGLFGTVMALLIYLGVPREEERDATAGRKRAKAA